MRCVRLTLFDSNDELLTSEEIGDLLPNGTMKGEHGL